MDSLKQTILSDFEFVSNKIASVTDYMNELKTEVENELEDGKQRQGQIAQIEASVKQVFGGKVEKVRLNIGGQSFATTKSTLLKDPQSYFAKILSTNFESNLDDSGEFFIDRDPTFFHIILNHLRGSNMQPTINYMSSDEYLRFKQEVTFYNISSLLETKCEASYLSWDPANSYPGLIFTNSNKTASAPQPWHNYVIAYASKSFSSGTHRWSIKVDKLMDNAWLAIGVANKTDVPGNNFCSYLSAYTCTAHGYTICNGTATPNSVVYGVGALIKVVLDCDNGTLQVNNVKMAIPAKKEFTPCAMFHHENIVVTFV